MISLNFNIKASKDDVCHICKKSANLGLNHAIVLMDDKIYHQKCALIVLTEPITAGEV